jgi:hypothetical protein
MTLHFDRYIAARPQEAEMMRSMPLAATPKLMMAVTGPLVGVVSGIVIGLFALAAGKLIRRPLVPTIKTAG